MGLLGGKVAIVTGGGQGIGRSEALYLASQGASVVVNDRGGLKAGTSGGHADSVAREIEQAGGRAVANHGDVSSWQDAEALVAQAVETYGRLDILVCNAGIVRDRVIYKMSEAEWDDVIRVHLKGHFAPTHFAAQHWRSRAQSGEATTGRIIYTSSEAGFYGHFGQSNYAAAKAGITGLGFTAAYELAKLGVTVNTISPRGRTPMTEASFGTFQAVEGFDEWDPDNIAPWVAFLASDAAADITGQVFVVYGGTVSLMTPWPVSAEISQNRRWSLDELRDQARKLFPDLSASPPPQPDIRLPPTTAPQTAPARP